MPAITAGIISSGVEFSTQYTIGSIGSDNSALGSFFIDQSKIRKIFVRGKIC